MCWAGIINTTIIGPFFFERNVDGEAYLQMLTDNVIPTLHRLGYDTMEVCLMHDGASAHYTRDVRQFLDDNFGSWIGRGDGDSRLYAWPARSPDLNMLDFFLWGVLQHRVNLVAKSTIEELVDAVIDESQNITVVTLEKVQEHLVKRLRKCIEVDGNIFEHLLKH